MSVSLHPGMPLRREEDAPEVQLHGREKREIQMEWVELDTTYVGRRTCPGTVRPPPPSKYDRCNGEVMEIWKR